MPKPKTGRQNYDWELIKQDYVTSDLSLRQIADKYGIRRATIYDKSKADNWFATKKEYQVEASAKAIAKACAKKADVLVSQINQTDAVSKAMDRILGDEDQFFRYIVTDSAPAPEGIGTITVTYDKVMEKADTKAIKDAMQTIKLIEETKRSLHNIMTERQKLERDRLQLERERFEFEQKKADFARPDNHNSIEIEGMQEGWCK